MFIRLHEAKHHVNVTVDMDEMDLTAAESKAMYEEIKEYVREKHGLKVSHFYIAQVKRKCGIIERENYNKAKSDDTKQPQCSEEKGARGPVDLCSARTGAKTGDYGCA